EELFEHIRLARAEEERDEARSDARAARAFQPIYLEPDERVRTLAIEPRGSYAVIAVGKPVEDERRTLIPDWITSSGYTQTREVCTKVGDIQSETGRIGIVSLADGSVQWLGIAAAAGDTTTEFSTARFLGWNDQGTHGLVAAVDGEYENAWLWSLHAATGALTELFHDTDDAWLAGPCPFWFACAGFLPDGRTVYFASERDGFSHVYSVSVGGGQPRQLTSGKWEVQSVDVAPTDDRFYLTTSEGTPHEVHFYHMDFDGGDRTRITMEPGHQEATPSPDGSRIAVVHSFANVPPDLYLGENEADAELRRVTTSPTAEWLAGPWIVPEIIRLTARDGVQLPARIYRPDDFGARPNGAAVIFVHGAGYLQNVHNWWSSYYREYMFHHLLAERGYIVLDLDYRGSAGYGRDWRTAIFRHMGGTDLTDQIDASRWLQEQHGIDPERIGIYGGSYGGFITLMALFTAPDEFGAGAALRSVTDWAHYNHGYTGRILNLPQDDSIAYK
ncbi:MAG: prolyl oligopeptidase family serine peptidase, partial [Longimicrobiales bacterium]